MTSEPLKCTGTRFSEAACRGSSFTKTGLPGTTCQQGPANWYISVTQIHTIKLTARPARDSNRDLVRVLGVAALICHSRQTNLIFQYLPFHDLVRHDQVGCARCRCSRDDLCPFSAMTQESDGLFASFRGLCLMNNLQLLCARMWFRVYALTVTSAMCDNITGETV